MFIHCARKSTDRSQVLCYRRSLAPTSLGSVMSDGFFMLFLQIELKKVSYFFINRVYIFQEKNQDNILDL